MLPWRQENESRLLDGEGFRAERVKGHGVVQSGHRVLTKTGLRRSRVEERNSQILHLADEKLSFPKMSGA